MSGTPATVYHNLRNMPKNRYGQWRLDIINDTGARAFQQRFFARQGNLDSQSQHYSIRLNTFLIYFSGFRHFFFL